MAAAVKPPTVPPVEDDGWYDTVYDESPVDSVAPAANPVEPMAVEEQTPPPPQVPHPVEAGSDEVKDYPPTSGGVELSSTHTIAEMGKPEFWIGKDGKILERAAPLADYIPPPTTVEETEGLLQIMEMLATAYPNHSPERAFFQRYLQGLETQLPRLKIKAATVYFHPIPTDLAYTLQQYWGMEILREFLRIEKVMEPLSYSEQRRILRVLVHPERHARITDGIKIARRIGGNLTNILPPFLWFSDLSRAFFEEALLSLGTDANGYPVQL